MTFIEGNNSFGNTRPPISERKPPRMNSPTTRYYDLKFTGVGSNDSAELFVDHIKKVYPLDAVPFRFTILTDEVWLSAWMNKEQFNTLLDLTSSFESVMISIM